MSLFKRHEVKRGGLVVGYVEHVRLGELWRAIAFGMPPYPPPMFSQKGYALEYVRGFGRAKDTESIKNH